MLQPILFVDEKKVEKFDSFRFFELKKGLDDCQDTIEFISDLSIKHTTDSGKLVLQTDPYLQSREIIFIHVSHDSPMYNEALYNALKVSQPNTIFARFSGSGELNINRESLRFNRKDHIYNQSIKGFQLAVRFYKHYRRFEPYLIVHGSLAFKKKIEEAQNELKWLKRNIKDVETLRRYGTSRNFTKIMSLANLDAARLENGKEYVKKIQNYIEYINLVEKYVQQTLLESQQNEILLQKINL